MQKNIVIVCDYAYVEGGAAKVAINTAVSLSKYNDTNVYFFAGSGEPCEELLASKVHIKSLKMYDLLGNPSKINAFINGIFNVEAGTQFESFIRQIGIEDTIVHIHSWTKVLSSAVFDVCKRLKVKTFLTIHDYFLICPNGGCFNYPQKHICEYNPMSLQCILCNCDSRHYIYKLWRCLRQIKQNSVINSFGDLHYIYISNFQKRHLEDRGLDLSNSSLLKNPIEAIDRYRISCEDNHCYLYIGRVTEEKGTELFCQAVTNTCAKGIVVGDGPLLDSLKQKYPSVTFTGWLNKEQIREVLNCARALVFPTLWYEGSPLTIPEVQAYGIPCIVTDCSSATDDIADGDNGVIVNADVDQISNAIIRFKDDLYVKQLSINTYSYFDKNRLSKTHYVESLRKIYTAKGEEK